MGGDENRKTGDKWFGKIILKAGLIYLPTSSSWQQTKHEYGRPQVKLKIMHIARF